MIDLYIIFLIMMDMQEIFPLDEKDRKILWLLSCDARMSFSKIAKMAGISKDIVNYRVRRLEDSGVLLGSYALVDPSCLGLMSARVWMKFQHVSPKIEKKIFEYYAGQQSTGWTVGRSGEFDYGTTFWGNSVSDLYETKTKVLHKFGQYMHRFEVGIYSRQHFFDKKYLGGKEECSLHKIICDSKKEDLDGSDMKVLRLLTEDGRMPVVEIAKRIGENPYSVNYRLKRLMKNAIKTFLPRIDLAKIGYSWYKISIYLEDHGAMGRLLAFCSSQPNVTQACEFLVGGADLEIDVNVRSHAELRDLSDRMMAQFSREITHLEFAQYGKEYKVTFMPMGESDETA